MQPRPSSLKAEHSQAESIGGHLLVLGIGCHGQVTQATDGLETLPQSLNKVTSCTIGCIAFVVGKDTGCFSSHYPLAGKIEKSSDESETQKPDWEETKIGEEENMVEITEETSQVQPLKGKSS